MSTIHKDTEILNVTTDQENSDSESNQLKTPDFEQEPIKRKGGWQLEKKRGPLTDEMKKSLSVLMAERHAEKGHPLIGTHVSDETKAKISAANTGKIHNKDNHKKRAFTQRMPKEKEDLIISLYISGAKTAEIVEKANTNPSVIYRVLERNNIKKRGAK